MVARPATFDCLRAALSTSRLLTAATWLRWWSAGLGVASAVRNTYGLRGGTYIMVRAECFGGGSTKYAAVPAAAARAIASPVARTQRLRNALRRLMGSGLADSTGGGGATPEPEPV